MNVKQKASGKLSCLLISTVDTFPLFCVMGQILFLSRGFLVGITRVLRCCWLPGGWCPLQCPQHRSTVAGERRGHPGQPQPPWQDNAVVERPDTGQAQACLWHSRGFKCFKWKKSIPWFVYTCSELYFAFAGLRIAWSRVCNHMIQIYFFL